MGTVTMVMSAETAKGVEAFMKVENAGAKLEEKLARIAAKSKDLDQVGRSTKGIENGFLSSLLAADLLSKGFDAMAKGARKAIDEVLAAFKEMEKEKAKAGEALKTDTDYIKEIGQIAKANVPGQDVDSLVNRYLDLSANAGISRQAAFDMVFQGVSTDREKAVLGLSKDLSKFVPDEGLSALMDAAFTIQQNAPDASMREIINMAGAVAETSKLKLAQLGVPVADAMQIAKATQGGKFNVEEVIGAIGATVGPTTSPEKAVTQFNAFMTGLGKAGMKGMDVIESIEAVKRLDPGSEEYTKVLGRQESLKFFETAKAANIQDDIRAKEQAAFAARAASGTAGSYISEKGAGMDASKYGSAVLGRAQAGFELDAVRLQKLGIGNLRRDEAIDREMTFSIKAGESEWVRVNRLRALTRIKERGFMQEGETVARVSDAGAAIGSFWQSFITGDTGWRARRAEPGRVAKEMAEQRAQWNNADSDKTTTDALRRLPAALDRMSGTLADKEQGANRGM